MGNLLSYSGISTKIRAMQSKLINEEQIREILELSSIPQVTAYLKRTPEYSKVWASLDEASTHRGQLEKLLKASIFHNFSKIYQFANPEQRRFLDLYSRRYEIRVLKEIMTNLFDHRDTDPVDVSPYREFFRRHSRLDIDRLVACTNMEEFINALKGNEFYGPLSRIQNRENALLFDYGMALDLYYFSLIWHVRKKLFSGNDLKEITMAYGEKFDMLNLQWIYRSKRYYHMTSAQIYALLIPVHHRLKKDVVKALVEAENMSAFSQLLEQTYYAKRYDSFKVDTLESMYAAIMKHILSSESRQDPYSVATIYSYLYHKEHEVNRLIIALECVRYRISADEAMQHIAKT